MIFPAITAATAAVIALLQIYLMMSVGLVRVRTGIGIGDGGEEALALKMRRHGNLIENAPIFLILLAFVELAGSPVWLVVTLGTTFVMARFAHAAALSRTAGPHPLRPVGALGTVLSIAAAGGYLLWLTATG